MPFASQALNNLRDEERRRIRVTETFSKTGWRWMIYWRAGFQIHLKIASVTWYFAVWLCVRACSKGLALLSVGDGTFGSKITMREFILRLFLKIIRKKNEPWWELFWHSYFLCTDDPNDFITDYTEAWKLQDNFDVNSIVVFVDNECPLTIPCSVAQDWGDEALLKHLRIFYDLNRARGGLLEFFGARTSQRIDIVEFKSDSLTVVKRVGAPLALGNHGPYNRQIRHFKHPTGVKGTSLKRKLVSKNVLKAAGSQTYALNIVRTWDPYATSILVLFPVILSLIVSIIWSVVSSMIFKGDVQAATQTGFTIGSYVVTAGALLIALVAFLDTKVTTMSADHRARRRSSRPELQQQQD